MSPAQWLAHLPDPTPQNQELERIFLEDHWGYGGLIHSVTANALVTALGEGSEIHVGHGLFLRLFSEYATTLETLGAWGWTMRNRRDYPSLLDGFLAYGHGDPRKFFGSVRRSRSGSLRLLLRLPSQKKLVAATRESFGYESDSQTETALAECFKALRLAADDYFAGDEIVRTTYNKAKHGATMLRMPDDDPRTFRVVMPHLLVKSPADKMRYDVSRFTVSKQEIEKYAGRITIFGGALQFLQGVARALHQRSAL